jgi:hypothetical protein
MALMSAVQKVAQTVDCLVAPKASRKAVQMAVQMVD